MLSVCCPMSVEQEENQTRQNSEGRHIDMIADMIGMANRAPCSFLLVLTNREIPLPLYRGMTKN